MAELLLLSRVAFRGREITGPRLRNLLALLADDLRTGSSTSRLVAGLWPDEQPENPTKALQVLVSRVRSQPGSDVVTSSPTGYRLALDAEQVDAVAVQVLAVAAAASTRSARGIPEASRYPWLRDARVAVVSVTYPELPDEVRAELPDLRGVLMLVNEDNAWVVCEMGFLPAGEVPGEVAPDPDPTSPTGRAQGFIAAVNGGTRMPHGCSCAAARTPSISSWRTPSARAPSCG